MAETYRCAQSVSTTRPEDFLVQLKEGVRLPLPREVYSGQNRGQRPRLQLQPALQSFRGEDRFRIGAGNFAHRNPANAADQRAN